MARVRQVTTAAAAAVVLRALHSAILLGICLEDEKHSFMMKGNLLLGLGMGAWFPITNPSIGGVFVEAGAYDGEQLSNTLYLERNLGWKGLLVEPDPWNFWSLRKKGRKAHLVNACLSPSPYPREVTFKQSDTMGHIASQGEEANRRGIFTRVKCFPLYSLLLAINTTKVDLLSLDVEGAELQVLKTLPWEKVKIQVLCIEHRHIPEGSEALRAYLEERGYALHTSVGDDYIFVRKDLEKIPQEDLL